MKAKYRSPLNALAQMEFLFPPSMTDEDYVEVSHLLVDIQGKETDIHLNPPFKAKVGAAYIFYFFKNKNMQIYELDQIINYKYTDNETNIMLS